jgi:hypothetical protein
MTMHFAYVGAALIALALLAAWMFVVSRRHVVVRICGATIAVVLAAASWINITAMLGYAVDAEPSSKVQIIGFLPDVSHDKIYLWVREPDGPRAYVVIYAEGLANGLIKGQQEVQGSGGAMRMMLSFNGKKPTGERGAQRHGSGSGNAITNLSADDPNGNHFHIDVESSLPPKS